MSFQTNDREEFLFFFCLANDATNLDNTNWQMDKTSVVLLERKMGLTNLFVKQITLSKSLRRISFPFNLERE